MNCFLNYQLGCVNTAFILIQEIQTSYIGIEEMQLALSYMEVTS